MTVVTTNGATAPLAVVDEDGRTIDPSALAFGSRPLADEELNEIADRARAAGRAFERDGLGLYALGAAMRLIATKGFADSDAAAKVLDALARITPLAGEAHAHLPIALGSLPFETSSSAELVVPRVLARRDHHGTSLVVVAPRDALHETLRLPLATAPRAPTAIAPPDHFELISTRSHESFKQLVSDAVEAIRGGAFEKVVVAREVEVRANRRFAPKDLLERLRALYPSCAAFSFGDFVGASPELLCRREGSLVRTHPLAGTVARSGDPDEDERLARSLLASPKDRSEHGIVVNAIVEALLAFTPDVSASPEPHLLELRNVVHLATMIEAKLETPQPGVLELALALHPTPAVGGFPRPAALAWLHEHEALDRSRYAGPLGFMDAAGDGEFWLGIRSALLDGERARLLAGVGIVADSDPALELAETQLKLQALLAAAVRP